MVEECNQVARIICGDCGDGYVHGVHFWKPIWLCADVATCWTQFRCIWNCLPIIVVTFWAPVPWPFIAVQLLSIFCYSHRWNLLPNGHPVWPLHSVRCSALTKRPSSGDITWVHHLVHSGIVWRDIVGLQVERNDIIPALLPLTFLQRLCLLHSLPHNFSHLGMEPTALPLFWSCPWSLLHPRCCSLIHQIIGWITGGLDMMVLMSINCPNDYRKFWLSVIWVAGVISL